MFTNFFNFITKPELKTLKLNLKEIEFFESKEYIELKKCPIYFYNNYFEIDTIFSPYKTMTNSQNIIIDSFINKNLCLYEYTSSGTNVFNTYELLCYWLILNYPNYNIHIHLPTNIHVYNFAKDIMRLNMFVDKKLRANLAYDKMSNTVFNPNNNSYIRIFTYKKDVRGENVESPSLNIVHNLNIEKFDEYFFKLYHLTLIKYIDKLILEKTEDDEISEYGPMGFLYSSDENKNIDSDLFNIKTMSGIKVFHKFKLE